MTINYVELTVPELRRLLASTFTAAMECHVPSADRLAAIGDAAAHLVELERLLDEIFAQAEVPIAGDIVQ